MTSVLRILLSWGTLESRWTKPIGGLSERSHMTSVLRNKYLLSSGTPESLGTKPIGGWSERSHMTSVLRNKDLLSSGAPESLRAGLIGGWDSCIACSSPEPAVHVNWLKEIFFL
jgi:hypothetical protein